MVAGWFDIFVRWQMKDFAALRKAGCDSRITTGPWCHGDKEVVRASVHDSIDWFNRHLLGGSIPIWPQRSHPFTRGPALENLPYSVDNTTLEARSDVLTYTSEPLLKQRIIIGIVTAQLYVSSSAPSADFFAVSGDQKPSTLPRYTLK
jgi:hypothetical protein